MNDRGEGNRLIFSCLKNEGAFLLEWLAWHRWLGGNRFLLFTNDCLDGTDRLADALAEAGIVEHVRNDRYDKRGPQWSALRSQALKRALRHADWAMHLDVDEFMTVRTGAGRLLDLEAAIGPADAISVPWRFFGNAGVAQYTKAPITAQFTRCGHYPVPFPRQTMMFKTLFRPGSVWARPGIHAPRLSEGATADWRNGDGRAMSETFQPERPLLTGVDTGNSLAQINHYALRSRESFLVKAARGLPNRSDVSIDLGYWVLRNFNDQVDDGFLVHQDAIAAEIAFLRSLPGVAAAEAEAIGWHQAEISRLMTTEVGVSLYASLAVAGDSLIPPMAEATRIYNGYAAALGAGA